MISWEWVNLKCTTLITRVQDVSGLQSVNSTKPLGVKSLVGEVMTTYCGHVLLKAEIVSQLQ